MNDIAVVPLETLQESIKAYAGKKVRIAEFKFFFTPSMIYPDYFLQIGPKGGVTAFYGRGGKTTIGSYAVTAGSVGKGIKYEYGSECTITVGLLSAKEIPAKLAMLESRQTKLTKQYEKTYLKAKATLTEIKTLVTEYPEYSL